MKKHFQVSQCFKIKGKISLPGDKSIAHRAVILSALSQGVTAIKNFPIHNDSLATINCFRKLGVKIRPDLKNNSLYIFGRGLTDLKKPNGAVFAGESGTTFRLLMGVLAGQKFQSVLTAGKSLSLRPMFRVNYPLRLMGAEIKAQRRKNEEFPPIVIRGGRLKGISYKMPVASAQVKSAILLAGLYANSKSKVIEKIKTRDHTERMLELFGADIRVRKNNIEIFPASKLKSPGKVYIPADISSASFFMVLAAILPDAEIVIKNVSLNPHRLGVVNVLKKMKADIRIKRLKAVKGMSGFEPMGDIKVKSSRLSAVKVKSKQIPSLIDELPILMVAACFAKGVSVFESVGELRVKETDRINSMCFNLKRMGAKIKIQKKLNNENIIIEGTKVLTAAKVRSFGDHRTAMSMVIAGLAARGLTSIDDISCINKSFPGFLKVLKTLTY